MAGTWQHWDLNSFLIPERVCSTTMGHALPSHSVKTPEAPSPRCSHSTRVSCTSFLLLCLQSYNSLELSCPMWSVATCGYSDLNYIKNLIPRCTSNISGAQQSQVTSGYRVGQTDMFHYQNKFSWIVLFKRIKLLGLLLRHCLVPYFTTSEYWSLYS